MSEESEVALRVEAEASRISADRERLREITFELRARISLLSSLSPFPFPLSNLSSCRYFELAKNDRERHKLEHPGWSARENYALNKKKKRKRDKSVGQSSSLFFLPSLLFSRGGGDKKQARRAGIRGVKWRRYRRQLSVLVPLLSKARTGAEHGGGFILRGPSSAAFAYSAYHCALANRGSPSSRDSRDSSCRELGAEEVPRPLWYQSPGHVVQVLQAEEEVRVRLRLRTTHVGRRVLGTRCRRGSRLGLGERSRR